MTLEAQNLSIRFGSRTILDDVSVRLEKGRFVAVLGSNGSGKTTLLRALSGDLDAASGGVFLDGLPLATLRPGDIAKTRSVFSQAPPTNIAFKSRDVVSMGRFPHSGYGRSSRKDIEIIDQALERSGITHLASRMFSELSGGEASRVSFARVLAQQSSYLLLDEPTASLDPKFQSHILRMAQAEARAGAGVLANLHDVNHASMFADDVIMLRDGSVITQGVTEDVLSEENLSRAFDVPFVRIASERYPRGAFMLA